MNDGPAGRPRDEPPRAFVTDEALPHRSRKRIVRRPLRVISSTRWTRLENIIICATRFLLDDDAGRRCVRARAVSHVGHKARESARSRSAPRAPRGGDCGTSNVARHRIRAALFTARDAVDITRAGAVTPRAGAQTASRHHPTDGMAMPSPQKATTPSSIRPLNWPPFLMLAAGIAEVLLVDVLGLRQQARRDEPAAADLPALGADVAGDAGQRRRAPCCSGRRRTASRRAGSDRPCRRAYCFQMRSVALGRRLALGPLDDAEQLQAAELHERVHLQRRHLVLEAGVDQPGVLLRATRSPRCSPARSSSASRRGRRRRACCSSPCRS